MNSSKNIYSSQHPLSSIIRLMTFYAMYRVLLAITLLLLFYMSYSQASAFFVQPILSVSMIYLIASAMQAVVYQFSRNMPGLQLFGMVLIDIVAICTLDYLQKDILGSLNILLMVTIAAAGLTLRTQYAYMCAALASIGVLIHLFASGVLRPSGWSTNIQQGGLLGIAYFSVCSLTHQLSKRLQASEALTIEQAEDIHRLTELNQQIIARMRTGILVVDKTGDIILSNDSATQLLGTINPKDNLNRVSPVLCEEFNAWLKNDLYRSSPLRGSAALPMVIVSFSAIENSDDKRSVIIFIEDYAFLSSRAQRIKLASLGRLSASVAHEIRNPLGAISHASQILAESLQNPDEQKLIKIVLRHVDRMNTIVENVMQLSRRSLPTQARFDLTRWLAVFWSDYVQGKTFTPRVKIQVNPPDLEVTFDKSHLSQVLGNLLDNACHYAQVNTSAMAEIIVNAGHLDVANRPYLDVIDNGPGVANEAVPHLFEPFYTTNIAGTGLGLYICKELCEINQASLDYLKTASGACFRITFCHPKRRLVL